jgi:branched-chain amino acid transport system ATP-binding protein
MKKGWLPAAACSANWRVRMWQGAHADAGGGKVARKARGSRHERARRLHPGDGERPQALRRRVALNEASLTVKRGSITGVIGPTAGQVHAVQHHRRHACAQRRPRADRGQDDGSLAGGHLPAWAALQISRLFAEMTVMENLVAVAHGIDDRRAVRRAIDLLEFLEITAIADKWGSELSYGQRKLVEIARALMLEPVIMLLDEPFAGINPRLQNRIVEHLKALCAKGLTVFFIDHEMRIVLAECDLVYVLAEATAACGPPAGAQRPQGADAYF